MLPVILPWSQSRGGHEWIQPGEPVQGWGWDSGWCGEGEGLASRGGGGEGGGLDGLRGFFEVWIPIKPLTEF